MSSKGQITVPKVVRDALGLAEGDQVVFRLDGQRAVMARTPGFLDLAGAVVVPVDTRGAVWADVVASTRANRAAGRR